MSEDGRRVSRLTLGLLAGFLLLSGALVSIPFLIRSPLPVIGAGVSGTFASDAVRAEVRLDQANNFVLLFAVEATGAAGADAPELVFEMPNHEMLPLRPEVVAIGAGAYRATGRLPMGGNWVMRIANDGESHEFPFVLREF